MPGRVKAHAGGAGRSSYRPDGDWLMEAPSAPQHMEARLHRIPDQWSEATGQGGGIATDGRWQMPTSVPNMVPRNLHKAHGSELTLRDMYCRVDRLAFQVIWAAKWRGALPLGCYHCPPDQKRTRRQSGRMNGNGNCIRVEFASFCNR